MYQIATECNTYFQNVLGLPNYRFKKHPNAPIPVLIFQKKARIAVARPTSHPLNDVKACAVSPHGSFKYRF